MPNRRRSPRVLRVAVLVETSNAYGREIQRGIAEHARGRGGGWSVFAEQHELGALPPPWLLRQKWDGVLSRPTTRALARAFRRMNVPVVDLNDLHDGLGFPLVRSDDRAIGALAAGHLRERGFADLAYCGFSGEPWARARRAGFEAAAGGAVPAFETPWRGRGVLPWAIEQRRLGRWLAGLPRRVGILACNDVRGRHVLELCRRDGRAVPDAVAVVGVDDDELLCGMSDPPLSSVVPDARRIGRESAALLDRLMAGQRVGPMLRRVPPVRVEARRSTDALAVDDAEVAAALRFIRARACEGLRVADVLRAVPLSRSALERRFKQCVGRSPHAEIRVAQLRAAARLLAETDLPLKSVAARCGVGQTTYLSYLFRRQHGVAPGAYRALHATDRKTTAKDRSPGPAAAR